MSPQLFQLLIVLACGVSSFSWDACDWAKLPNVALDKTTDHGPGQYETVERSGSYRAVDGLHSTLGEYCTHTLNDPINWWLVDLGGLFQIHGLAILTRDSWPSRTQNFTLDVFREDPRIVLPAFPEGFGEICAYRKDELPASSWTTFGCESVLIGRFLRLVKYGYAYLHFCELEVYATGTTVSKTFHKLSKSTTPSGDSAEFGTFDSAIDCIMSVLTCPEVHGVDFDVTSGLCQGLSSNVSTW